MSSSAHDLSYIISTLFHPPHDFIQPPYSTRRVRIFRAPSISVPQGDSLPSINQIQLYWMHMTFIHPLEPSMSADLYSTVRTQGFHPNFTLTASGPWLRSGPLMLLFRGVTGPPRTSGDVTAWPDSPYIWFYSPFSHLTLGCLASGKRQISREH
jgi:hypothetical protein